MTYQQTGFRSSGITCLAEINLCLNCSAALFCLAWLLLIPADTKNAWLFGFSSRRLGLALFFLTAIVINLLGILILRRGPSRFSRFLKIAQKYSVVLAVLNLVIFVLCVFLLVLPAQAVDTFSAALIRLRPFIAWTTITVVQGFIFASLARSLDTPDQLADFDEGMITAIRRLLTDRSWTAPAAAGAVSGVIGAYLMRLPVAALVSQIPPVLPFFLSVGFTLLVVGLLYNGWMVRAAPLFIVILILTGTIVSLTRYPSDIAAGRANFRLLPNASALALGQEFHYSLSVYHILSSLYPNSLVTSPPGLVDAWGLQRDRMINWIPSQLDETASYDPNLTTEQVDLLLALEPDEVEINTLGGSVYYYFLPPKQPSASPSVYLFQSGRRRFVLPADALDTILPGFIDS